MALLGLATPSFAHDTEEQQLLASDGAAGDRFGRAVAIDDERVAVGAPVAGGIGAVYIFEHDGVDFAEEAKLTPLDGAAGDLFGQSVAVFGETVLVGAPGHDGAGADAGAVYVFVHLAGVWTQEAKILPTISVAGDAFGYSVTGNGDTAAIGAPRNGVGAGAALGSAYIFVRSAGIWSEEAEIIAADGTAGDNFGTSVSVQFDTLLVGALRATGRVASSGAAYVYDRSAALWSETIKLQDVNGNASDFFGISVSLHNNFLVVGASGDDDNGSASGSAFNFALGATGWAQVGHFKGLGSGDLFGGSVSRAYRASLVGGRLDDDGASNAGTAQIFVGFPGRLGYEIYVASDAAASNFLGSSVSISSCYLVSGAPGHDGQGNDAGAAYLYITQHPSAVLANGSNVNPTCMTTTAAPTVGQHWEIEIDTTPYPTGAISQVIVYQGLAATPTVRPIGEILVDRNSGFIAATLELGTGTVVHEFLMPNDPYLVGLQFAAQGLVREIGGTYRILGLCNAENLAIGCAAEGGHHTP